MKFFSLFKLSLQSPARGHAYKNANRGMSSQLLEALLALALTIVILGFSASGLQINKIMATAQAGKIEDMVGTIYQAVNGAINLDGQGLMLLSDAAGGANPQQALAKYNSYIQGSTHLSAVMIVGDTNADGVTSYNLAGQPSANTTLMAGTRYTAGDVGAPTAFDVPASGGGKYFLVGDATVSPQVWSIVYIAPGAPDHVELLSGPDENSTNSTASAKKVYGKGSLTSAF